MTRAFYTNAEDLLSKLGLDVKSNVCGGLDMIVYETPGGYVYCYNLENAGAAFERKKKKLPFPSSGKIEHMLDSRKSISKYEAIGIIVTEMRPTDA